jgi:tetratricopeptide (TPR) repeat protein
MANRRTSMLVALALGASLFAAQPILANGGGGGAGGMAAPSTPQYDPAVEYQKGVQAYEAKDFKAAASAFKRVIEVAPRHAPAQYFLGASYIGLNDYKKAKRPLEAAVKAEGTLIEARRDLGVTHAKLGDAAKAGEQRAAIAALKAACAAPCALAARYDAAVAAIDAALTGVTPTAFGPAALPRPGEADATYVLAVGLINEGRYAEAIGQLEAGLWSAGPNPDLLTYLGFANRKLKRYDTAKAWYEGALAIAPNHLGALEYYGELKLEMGDVAGAKAHLARLDKLCGFGCQQADELRQWLRDRPQSAS